MPTARHITSAFIDWDALEGDDYVRAIPALATMGGSWGRRAGGRGLTKGLRSQAGQGHDEDPVGSPVGRLRSREHHEKRRRSRRLRAIRPLAGAPSGTPR